LLRAFVFCFPLEFVVQGCHTTGVPPHPATPLAHSSANEVTEVL